ncbi:MAG: hypothetical protein ACLP4V_09685 [Methylocella sp.]
MKTIAFAAVAWGANRLDIFALGTDNSMYHKSWDGSAWQPSMTNWDALGGTFNSPPAAVSWGANRLDIFALGTDNSMYHKAWDGRAWAPLEALGGTFNTPLVPAPVVTGLQMQYQQMSNWCWIAVATSISHYYNPASTWTQCSLTTAQLQASASLHMQGQCCPDAQLLASSPGLAQKLANPYSLSSEYALDGVNSQLAATPTGICNHTGDIAKALTQTGNLNRETGSVVGISDLLNELSAGRPVCINIAWSGGGGHFIAATGVELPDTVIVEDPVYGPSALPYQTLANSYQGNGTWTDSYYTQP